MWTISRCLRPIARARRCSSGRNTRAGSVRMLTWSQRRRSLRCRWQHDVLANRSPPPGVQDRNHPGPSDPNGRTFPRRPARRNHLPRRPVLQRLLEEPQRWRARAPGSPVRRQPRGGPSALRRCARETRTGLSRPCTWRPSWGSPRLSSPATSCRLPDPRFWPCVKRPQSGSSQHDPRTSGPGRLGKTAHAGAGTGGR